MPDLRFTRPLPDEVLLEIIKNVDDVKTLAAFSRTSKKLHAFTESYLYSTFVQVDEFGEAMPLFLRTVLQKPHLGRYVKKWVGTACQNLMIEMSHLNDAEMVMLQLAVRWVATPKKDIEKWEILAKNGHWDSLAAILLCLLPNLEEVNFIEYGCNEGMPYVESILRRAAELQQTATCHSKKRQPPRKGLHTYPEEDTIFMKLYLLEPDAVATEWPPLEFSLHNLRRVSLFVEEEDNFPKRSIEAYQALPYLELNSVETFAGHMVGGSFKPIWNAWDPPIDTVYEDFRVPDFEFSTSELILRHSTLGDSSLVDFLHYFKALKRFEYNFDYDLDCADEQQYHVDCLPPRISDSIAHLQDTLEELSLTQEKFRDEIMDDNAALPIHSLKDFGNLRKLTASANMLLGRHPPDITTSDGNRSPEPSYNMAQIYNFTQLFPPCLEHLIIRHCDSAIFDAVIRLLNSTLPPKLKTIELEFKDYCDCGRHDDAEKMVEKLANQRGITLEMDDQGPHSCTFCYEKWSRKPKGGYRNAGDWSLSQNTWFLVQ